MRLPRINSIVLGWHAKSSILLILSLLLVTSNGRAANSSHGTIEVDGHQVRYDLFGDSDAPSILIFLHGASGPSSYHEEARSFVRPQCAVVLLHYFDATHSHAPSGTNYQEWVRAVAEMVTELRRTRPAGSPRKISLMGVSLGASVALAAGSQGTEAKAVVDWYGSLPDYFFYHFKTMPPLLILHGVQDTIIPVQNALQLQKLCALDKLTCESHLYPQQGHGFFGSDLHDAEERTMQFLCRFTDYYCAERTR